MKTIVLVLLAAAQGVICVASSPTELDPKPAQATVDAVVKMLEPYKSFGQVCKAKQWEVYPTRNVTLELREEFDVHNLLSVLPGLRMADGYRLDYMYPGNDRLPFLYARQTKAPPATSYGALTNAVPKEWQHRSFLQSAPTGKFFLEKIRTDGTKESFFHLAVLCLMGDQFLHTWHDRYHDELIVCAKSGLDQLFAKADAEGSDFGKRISDKIRQTAYALDLTPRVQMDKDGVIIAVVVFTKWGGFQRRTYTVCGAAPHKLMAEKTEWLVLYQCGYGF